MAGGWLPNELADAIRAARRVERAAVNEAQRSRAIAATSRLMLAAAEAQNRTLMPMSACHAAPFKSIRSWGESSSVALVKIDFVAGRTDGAFERSNATGRAVLRLGDKSVTLQSPWNPLTHFHLSTTRTWRAQLEGHEIVVTKKRARLLGGLRESDYKIVVDGHEVERRRGL